MPWLVRDGKVLATIEVATSLRDRTRGLLGRDSLDGAILLKPARSVHTIRMRFPIDVAFCNRDLKVVKVVTLHRNRVSMPVLKARSAIECEAGMLKKWGVRRGDRLEIRGLDDGTRHPGRELNPGPDVRPDIGPDIGPAHRADLDQASGGAADR
jgi:uncharacterized membrane protein (UPF0127 family)